LQLICPDNKKTMSRIITLLPEHEQLIEQAIQSGPYQNPEQVIGWALETLRSEDESLRDQRSGVASHLRALQNHAGAAETFLWCAVS